MRGFEVRAAGGAQSPMAIIVSKNDGGDARIVQKSEFEQEVKIQQYIHAHPEAIPVYDIQSEKRLFVAAREFLTESGPIDAIAVDKDGDIYVVETKLYANPDKRRVVAQVLDYGASLWKHFGGFDKFLLSLNKHTQKTWQCDFRQKVQETYGLKDEETGELLESMEANLGSGNLKFVVLMDSMEERLKDLITYINQKSQFDIYGVELEYYKHDEYEIVIPKMYGVEVKKDAPPATGRKKRTWNEQEFLQEAETSLEAAKFGAVKEVYEFSKRIADHINWGSGITGTFNPVVTRVSRRALFSIATDGTLDIPFERLNDSEAAGHARDEMKQRLESVLEVTFPADYQSRKLSYPVDKWYRKVAEFESAIKHAIGE
jgi:hypothetical protein